MSYAKLLTDIILLSPEEMEKELKKLNDYATCWSEALTFALEQKVDFLEWYEKNKNNLH